MKITRICLGIVITVALLPAACSKQEEPQKVDLEKRSPAARHDTSGERHLRVAVGGMITPKAGFGYYRQFLDYIHERSGIHVDYVDREGYAQINELVRTGKVDLAFVCGGPYVDGHKAFGMELLVAPQAHGRQVYYSYIIVHKDSGLKTFRDLRGRSFAFTDPLSNSGKLVPTYLLAKMGETPDTFFKAHIFTKAHDKSIKAVAERIVDGAAVDSLIWEYEDRTAPRFTSATTIIERSPPYGIPPVVVRKDLDPGLKEQLRGIFLDAHRDGKGSEILKGMMIDKFLPIEDSAYDSIREMQAWVAGQEKRTGRNR